MLFYSMSYLYNMAPDYMSLKPTSVTQELCVFGQVTNLSVPQFPHLQNKSEENNSKLHPPTPRVADEVLRSYFIQKAHSKSHGCYKSGV